MMLSNSVLQSGSRGAWFVLVAPAALFAVVAGCGKPAYQLETAPLRGIATLDGRPLTSGYVVIPVTRGRMASGKLQPDGSFVMTTYEEGDGAQIGAQRIAVNPIPLDEFMPAGQKRVAIPDRYQRAGTSGFTVDVKPGEDNYIELHMTTKEEKNRRRS